MLALAVLLGVAMFAATATASAQEYRIDSDTGNSIVPGTDDIGLNADDDVRTIALPFSVTFYGMEYTEVTVSSNGNLQFGDPADANNNFDPGGCAPSDRFTLPTLFAFQDDLRTDAAGDGVFTAVQGQAGERRFIIEYRASYFGSGAPVNFEVIFFEGSQSIRVIYGENGGAEDGTNTDGNNQNILLGLQQSSTGPATQFSCGDDDYPVQGLRVIYDRTAPASAAAVPECSRSGDIPVRVTDDRGGSGADLVRFRIDGGEVRTANTSEGTATLSVAEGRHRLDYRGRDRAGNEPSAFESQDVVVDRTDPNVAVTSNQNQVNYRVGESGSATVRASDGNSGLVEDPSGQVVLDTSSPGVRTIARTARDRCGNEATASYSYRVVRAARVGLTGVNSSDCRTRNFSARVRVRSATATRTQVFLDGRRLKSTQLKNFRVRIQASRLSSGRHGVRVVTVDRAGNRTVRRATFRRCARALRFTG